MQLLQIPGCTATRCGLLAVRRRCAEARPPDCDREGGLSKQGTITRGRDAKAPSPHTPPRSKTKRGAKPDGSKIRAKCRKSGVQRSRERWGREPPRNPRCKETVERGRWPIKAPPTNGDSHTTVGPASGSWGGDEQLGGGIGKDRGPPIRGSAPQQCGERVPAHSLYTL